MSNRQREMELMSKGKKCFDSRDYKKAQMIFGEIIDINPQNAESFFYLANIFHIKGEIGKAIKAFSKVIQINPQHTDASISLSVLYNDIGRYDDAKRIFERAQEKVKAGSKNSGIQDPHINRKFSAKHYELADLYMSYNRYDEALFEYNKSVALNSENLDIRIKIAKVYAKKGFINKAYEELRKMKNEFPNFYAARNALGVLYYGNGRVVEAQNEWQNTLAKDPKNHDAAMYLNLSKTATETTL